MGETRKGLLLAERNGPAGNTNRKAEEAGRKHEAAISANMTM